jgi:hypothetical protein
MTAMGIAIRPGFVARTSLLGAEVRNDAGYGGTRWLEGA